jgi:hypothetical protein
MMKSTIRTLFLLSALLFSACEKDDSIFTELSIRFVMPDSRPVEKLEIRTDISYFDNINSGCGWKWLNRVSMHARCPNLYSTERIPIT